MTRPAAGQFVEGDEDEGQTPLVPLIGVHSGFGPMETDRDVASAFGSVGAGSRAKQMIELHRRLFPRADRVVFRRKADEGRSAALQELVTEVGEALNIANLEGVGVRGDGKMRVITLVSRTKSGRIVKAWAPYSILDRDDPAFRALHDAAEYAGHLADARQKGLPWAPGGGLAESDAARRGREAATGVNDGEIAAALKAAGDENDLLRAQLDEARTARDEAARAAETAQTAQTEAFAALEQRLAAVENAATEPAGETNTQPDAGADAPKPTGRAAKPR